MHERRGNRSGGICSSAWSSVVLLVGGIGGWAATSEFSGAVIAQGQLVVDTNVKKVQHPTGGVVAELHVRDGDQVKAGESSSGSTTRRRAPTLRSSPRGSTSSARAARARRPSSTATTASRFPAELLARKDDPEVARIDQRRDASCSRSGARRARA